MKLGEQWSVDGGKLIQKKTFDPNPTLDEVAQLKQTTPKTGDTWHVGRIPAWLMGEWIKEAGLDWSDTEAVRDLVNRKLLSGDFDALRPHTGSF